MKLNKKVVVPGPVTAEGAAAVRINAELALRRSVMSCMLWEDSFYESGVEIGKRIIDLVAQVRPEVAAEVARQARHRMKLRHVPLLIIAAMTKLPEHKRLVAGLLRDVIQRADEITEFMAIYHSKAIGSRVESAQVKKGIAAAFARFDEYALAKYDRGEKWKLRDALFLSHANPVRGLPLEVRQNLSAITRAERKAGVQRELTEREGLYKRLVDRNLATPDTHEVGMSALGEEVPEDLKPEAKRDLWMRLMLERKLGALAFVRNLRNMKSVLVPKVAVENYASSVDLRWVLPFRFVAAAAAVPGWEDLCDAMLLRCAAGLPKLPGKTIFVVDVSGSMRSAGTISKRSDMTRLAAAGALAAIGREMCEDARLYATAGNDGRMIHATAECPARRGMALVDTFTKHHYERALGGGGIFLVQCLAWIKEREKTADRIIVLTDEQDCDRKLSPEKADAFGRRNYLINVSVEKNGIGYKPRWVHVDGWSEHVLTFIREAEEMERAGEPSDDSQQQAAA